jgi:hypothetical protein
MSDGFSFGSDNTVDNTSSTRKPNFSPYMIPQIILRVLRFFFSQNKKGYKWSNDHHETDVLIYQSFEIIDREPIQGIPRIIVSRDGYNISPMGMNQSMTSADPIEVSKGLRRSKHAYLIQGGFTIQVEAQTEVLADMVSSFLTWSERSICAEFGLNSFGVPMTVGEPSMDKEGQEKFKVTIRSQYSAETHFAINQDAIKIGSLNLRVEA